MMIVKLGKKWENIASKRGISQKMSTAKQQL